jgi:C_GCAxxG_C_C family probable redox protein
MKKAEVAVSVFKDGFNCTQAVFSTIAPEHGLDGGTAARAATAFGGGLARRGETCGAVTGALMAIGLARGNNRPADKEVKERTYELAREFIKRFESRNGSIACRELLGCDISTPEGHERAKREGLFDTVCAKLVRDSVEIVRRLLAAES